MGLLDMFAPQGAQGNSLMDDPRNAGLLNMAMSLLQSSGPSTTPTSFGQAFGKAGMQGMQAMQQAQQQQRENEQAQQMNRMRELQFQQMQGSMQDQQAARQQSGIDQAAIRSAFAPYGSRPADMSPTIENAAKLGTTPQFDPRTFLANNPQASMAGLKAAMEMNASFNPSKRLKETTNETVDGKTVKVNWFEDGSHQIVNGMLPRTKMEVRTAGGHDYAYDPYAVRDGQTFKHSATIGEGLQGQRLQFEKSQALRPQFNTEVGGFISPPREGAPNGTLTLLAGYKKPDAPLTEVQGKASLFASRMDKANNIIEKLSASGIDNNGAIKRFAQSTGNAIGLGTDSFGGMLSGMAGSATNWTQSKEQQSVEQAKRDFINAVLRQESGAAIARSEFESADQQYFPQVNDDAATIVQKAQARQSAIDGMSMMAGPGAKRLGVGTSNDGWSITRN